MPILLVLILAALRPATAPAGGDTTAARPTLAVRGTALDADLTGTLIVLDRPTATLRLLDRTGVVISRTGGPGWSNDHFDAPAGVWARNGLDVFVADYGNHRIQRFDRGLAYVGTFRTRDEDDPAQRFGYPLDVALSRFGDLFILDGENNRILKVNGFSAVERTFGGFDAGEGRLLTPRRLALGPDDRVYVLDGSRVLVFDAFGNFLRRLPLPDDTTPAALCADERGIVVAAAGLLRWFDPSDRPSGVLSLDSTGRTGDAPLDIAAGTDSLYLLLPDGVRVLPDPRRP